MSAVLKRPKRSKTKTSSSCSSISLQRPLNLIHNLVGFFYWCFCSCVFLVFITDGKNSNLIYTNVTLTQLKDACDLLNRVILYVLNLLSGLLLHPPSKFTKCNMTSIFVQICTIWHQTSFSVGCKCIPVDFDFISCF